MTDMSSKPKNGMPQTRRVWQGYAALLVALGVCFGFLFCSQKPAPFPYSSDEAVFYPLLLLTRYTPLRVLFWIITFAALIGLLVVATRRRVFLLITLLIMLPGAGALFFAFFIMLLSSDIVPRQTILINQHQYHLLLHSQELRTTEMGHPSKAYIVIECDEHGLICRYKDTFHRISAGEVGYDALKKFDESGLLFVDEKGQSLKLRVGGDVYRVDDWLDRPW